ncbi:arf-GAP with dual PH domain-containing protein 1 isoform X1 [Pteronotus mesoamericanus]|uniref:arf-GAP with dual PH domain-containing protein 1 isoform X1 n=1 Tax=Pteronotus mesoamericanus TaxID=1884717 RepID=UPI0023EB568B|nr:arf-GAP with dual PH domain-containing protein 1 isoform X1 [Pteronotus parnellii mesoamericanus]
MATERQRAVLELLQRPGNAHCADCGAPGPDWASYTLGVFICLSCSGIHRNIPQISKVKSVRLDAWEEAQVEFMASHGNAVARATYEPQVPSFYYRPTASDCHLLREQWIRAKYERQEFTDLEKQEPYSAGYREGFLWKRGRDNGQFLSRKFVLTEREGALKYFNRNDAKEPKAVMKVEHLNATFQPAKIGHPHGLQVTYLKDNSTRNIFIYHEDGKPPPPGDGGLVQRAASRPLPLPAGGLPGGQRRRPGAQADQELPEGRLHGENRAQANRRLPEALVHHGRPQAPVLQGPAGRLRPGGGLHRQQGERLHGAGQAATVHPGPPLAARHHHRHAGAPVPAGLRDGGGAAGVGGGLPEGGGQAHAAAGVRSGSPLQA